jgi:hypothetical protein
MGTTPKHLQEQEHFFLLCDPLQRVFAETGGEIARNAAGIVRNSSGQVNSNLKGNSMRTSTDTEY